MSVGLFMPALLINPEIRVVLPSGNLVTDRMDLLFTPEQWASSATKRVIVESGVEIGTNSREYVLAIGLTSGGQANSFNGRLIFENSGIVSGRGGSANSGVGGNAIYANLPGRNGQKLEIINRGTLRAGGGGGGRGGNGGAGGGGYYHTTISEPPSGWYDYVQGERTYGLDVRGESSTYFYHWYWNGTIVAETDWRDPIQVGIYTYYAGDYVNRGYQIRRTWVHTTYTNGGGGGYGGNGGLGQGYGQANTGGNGGTEGYPGGTNAGHGNWGGAGGAGGTYGLGGARGNTGLTGTAGNNGGGYGGDGGSWGGEAGFYVDGEHYVEWLATGTRIGRVR